MMKVTKVSFRRFQVNASSFNGRTALSESAYLGSNPKEATICPAIGTYGLPKTRMKQDLVDNKTKGVYYDNFSKSTRQRPISRNGYAR